MTSTLLRSQIECPRCGEVIASIHRHDFQTCGCGGTMIDGGRDYLRVLGDAVPEAGGLEGFTRELFINGEHTDQSASWALKVYKALWSASNFGKEPASTTQVQGGLSQTLSSETIVRYLRQFSIDEESPVMRVGTRWLPKVPLAVRDDAP